MKTKWHDGVLRFIKPTAHRLQWAAMLLICWHEHLLWYRPPLMKLLSMHIQYVDSLMCGKSPVHPIQPTYTPAMVTKLSWYAISDQFNGNHLPIECKRLSKKNSLAPVQITRLRPFYSISIMHLCIWHFVFYHIILFMGLTQHFLTDKTWRWTSVTHLE